jgi:hypothetical protein
MNYNKSKSEQMFSIMVKAFKEASNKEKSSTSNDKKRKANENYAFDDDIFYGFNLDEKVAAIQKISAPTKKKELRRFIGMVNYYRDMWIRRSDVLAPLAALTSKTTPWKWPDEHQCSFHPMKQIVSREMLLAYLDFSKPLMSILMQVTFNCVPQSARMTNQLHSIAAN